MARDKRVRLSDDEIQAVKDARDTMYDEDVAEHVPLGKVINDTAEFVQINWKKQDDE